MMIDVAQKEKIQRLLRDTITAVCKNELTYIRELQVEGLIGITIDRSQVFLVNIRETVPKETGVDLTTNKNDIVSYSPRDPVIKTQLDNERLWVEDARLIGERYAKSTTVLSNFENPAGESCVSKGLRGHGTAPLEFYVSNRPRSSTPNANLEESSDRFCGILPLFPDQTDMKDFHVSLSRGYPLDTFPQFKLKREFGESSGLDFNPQLVSVTRGDLQSFSLKNVNDETGRTSGHSDSRPTISSDANLNEETVEAMDLTTGDIMHKQSTYRNEDKSATLDNESNSDETPELLKEDIPKRTIDKANWAHRVFLQWREWKIKHVGPIPNIEDMSTEELNKYVSLFVREVRKQDGARYPGKTLLQLVQSIQKWLYLAGKNRLLLGDGMEDVRVALKEESIIATAEGAGVCLAKADPITFEIEEQLWEKGVMGDHKPSSLIQAIFYLITRHFHITSKVVHKSLTVYNFTVVTDTNNNKFLRYSSKSGDKKMIPESRVYMNQTKPERCLVLLYEKYVSLCPREALERCFYLRPKADHVGETLWFTHHLLGHNTLSNTIKNMMAKAEVSGHYNLKSVRLSTPIQNHEPDQEYAFQMYMARFKEETAKRTSESDESVESESKRTKVDKV